MAARRGGLGKGLDSLISPGHSAKAEAKEKPVKEQKERPAKEKQEKAKRLLSK